MCTDFLNHRYMLNMYLLICRTSEDGHLHFQCKTKIKSRDILCILWKCYHALNFGEIKCFPRAPLCCFMHWNIFARWKVFADRRYFRTWKRFHGAKRSTKSRHKRGAMGNERDLRRCKSSCRNNQTFSFHLRHVTHIL